MSFKTALTASETDAESTHSNNKVKKTASKVQVAAENNILTLR